MVARLLKSYGLVFTLLALASNVSTGTAPTIQECFVGSVADTAVSAVNGKLDFHYGSVNSTYTRGVGGALSLPVGQSFGFKLTGFTFVLQGLISESLSSRFNDLLGIKFMSAESRHEAQMCLQPIFIASKSICQLCLAIGVACSYLATFSHDDVPTSRCAALDITRHMPA